MRPAKSFARPVPARCSQLGWCAGHSGRLRQHSDDQSPIHRYVIAGSHNGWDLGCGLRGRPDRYGSHPLRWRDIDGGVRSEVVTDAEQLVAQARE